VIGREGEEEKESGQDISPANDSRYLEKKKKKKKNEFNQQ
jgi:hypothetical protein